MIESKLGECVFTRLEIEKRVQEVAVEINQDYIGKRPLVISILRGAIFFTVDLVRSLTIPFDLDFMALSNFKTGFKKVEIEKDVDEEVADGVYLLELQYAAFDNDASPSRPILYKLAEK